MIKYYRQVETGKVFAYEAGQPVRADLVLLSESEVQAHMEIATASPVPASVSRFQARAALMQAGKLDAANAAVAKADDLTKLAWDDAQVFYRASPTVNALGAALGLSAEDLDALFIAAAQIEA